MPEDILDQDIRIKQDGIPSYAGFWVRTGAALLDTLILLPVIGLSFYNSFAMKSFAIMALCSLVSLLYKPLLEWKRSATFGKSILGLRLIDKDENSITGMQSLIRNSPWIASGILSFLVSVQLYGNEAFHEASSFLEIGELSQTSSLNSLNMLISFAFLIVVLIVAFDSRKQGAHDMMAKTFCVRTKE